MWITDLTVGFASLPPEKEDAYWAAIHYFAEVMFTELAAPAVELENGQSE